MRFARIRYSTQTGPRLWGAISGNASPRATDGQSCGGLKTAPTDRAASSWTMWRQPSAKSLPGYC
jgi:hypothetical protein